ncbi:MAG TPA: protein translocase subunit SecF [Ruminococcaceae bacterium]|nr:protein translocase subunit SecF [Oscillospiraceae bacterium]HAO69494.1 protein translocase subunit SecF [Oscillospiraceae bacterium]HCB65717.1 protein translocase subunit SecF [Oscillospiraceae bacterium]
MINFVEKRKWFYIIAVVCMVIIFGTAVVLGVPMDIQFKGGSMITYSYSGDLSVSEVEEVAESVIGSVNVQESQDVASGIHSVVITVAGSESLTTEMHESLTQAMEERFPDNNIKIEETDNVDPTMGKEFFAKCLVAVAFASLLMVVYIAFRFRKIGGWSAGAMCVVALVHDMIWVFAAFLFLRIPLNDNFIAAALTILGYSINNTIVIYDRVRENKRILGGSTPLGELVNVSINQTLKRSVMTTVTTMIALVTVCVVAIVYQLDSILSFALPMIIGMLAGLFSSLCLAPELWVSWKERSASRAKKA